jgi:hypothetical protein
MALTAARAANKTASDAYMFDTADKPAVEIARLCDAAVAAMAHLQYVMNLQGRIEREAQRRIDRNAKVLSRKSAAAKSR